MTKAEKEQIQELKDKTWDAFYQLVSTRNDLEAMGRKRDSARIDKAISLLSVWLEN